MTKNKLIWTAEDIILEDITNVEYKKGGKERYLVFRDKQFLDADEVKRIVENTRLCHECDTLDCRYNKIIRERLIKRLKLKWKR